MNIEKMKPIVPQNKTDITFGELGENLGFHPIIIFYSEGDEEYYYLKISNAVDKNRNLKEPKFNDVFIPANPNAKGLLKKDSYVDPTKIYRIKESELDQYVKEDDICGINQIDPIKALSIYDELLYNLTKDDPFCSIMEVSYDQNLKKFTSKTEYVHPDLLDDEWNKLQTKIIDKSVQIKQKWNAKYQAVQLKTNKNNVSVARPNRTNFEFCDYLANVIVEELGDYYKYSWLEVLHKKLIEAKIKVRQSALDSNRPYTIENIIEFENFLEENNYIQYHTYQEIKKRRKE
ncbi:hypothetical protein MCAV_02400 [[Mycoplasma] cavipharyngis]|uniref:Mbov_0400 family ICE element protein n=1 Tax=[Mycoplasma] cavipharyngis TaxID=92757 RepID=UPI003704D30D